jgi:hypothetical protein
MLNETIFHSRFVCYGRLHYPDFIFMHKCAFEQPLGAANTSGDNSFTDLHHPNP